MKKAKTCKYNANRNHTNIALPFCKWTPQEQVMPPHIVFANRGDLDFSTCQKCKAYEPVSVLPNTQGVTRPLENQKPI